MNCGSIPACAGEAPPMFRSFCPLWVYPRVCGGSGTAKAKLASPAGLSPRVRGKHGQVGNGDRLDRSIPACAGEALISVRSKSWNRVYPRVCGGSHSRNSNSGRQEGLSPRVRGKPAGRRPTPTTRGSIPACAGEALRGRSWRPGRAVYPRVCGGSAAMSLGEPIGQGLSPRVRGKLVWTGTHAVPAGSIPACAGEA